MKEPEIDAQRIAALLDGRLDERDRRELLARLASSEDDFAVFSETAAVLRELETDEGTGGLPRPPAPASAPDRPDEADALGVAPTPRARHWTRPPGRWLALAAGIAAVGLGLWTWRQVVPLAPASPGQYADRLTAGGAGLPPGWNGTPWAVRRGTGDLLPEDARAVQLGARVVDLEVAVRAVPAHDPAAVAELAGRVVALVEGIPGAYGATDAYAFVRDSAGLPRERLTARLEEGWEVVQPSGGEMAALGAWAEAGRIAAAHGDERFFARRDTRAALERAERATAGNADAVGALERVRRALESEDPPDWGARERALAELLRVLGS